MFTPSVLDELIRHKIDKLPKSSRYFLTRLHPDKTGRKPTVRWGIWNRPRIDMSQYYNYLVKIEDVGRLDRISKEYYDKEDYWWAIADVNHIKNQLLEMYPGMIIKIPLLSNIERALSEGNNALFY